MSNLVLSADGEHALELCRTFHATRKTFSGNGVLKHAEAVLNIARETGAQSALDYGCGKGAQFAQPLADGRTLEEALGFAVARFDPAVPEFAEPPEGQFDLVWCTDVLESVPEADIPAVLEDVASYAAKAVFITVATFPAKKTFADGTNTHLTVKSKPWWNARFTALRKAHPDLKIETRCA